MTIEDKIAGIARRLGLNAGLAGSTVDSYTVYIWAPESAPTGKLTMGVAHLDCQRVIDGDERYIEAELRAAFERAKKDRAGDCPADT